MYIEQTLALREWNQDYDKGAKLVYRLTFLVRQMSNQLKRHLTVRTEI